MTPESSWVSELNKACCGGRTGCGRVGVAYAADEKQAETKKIYRDQDATTHGPIVVPNTVRCLKSRRSARNKWG